MKNLFPVLALLLLVGCTEQYDTKAECELKETQLCNGDRRCANKVKSFCLELGKHYTNAYVSEVNDRREVKRKFDIEQEEKYAKRDAYCVSSIKKNQKETKLCKDWIKKREKEGQFCRSFPDLCGQDIFDCLASPGDCQ